MTRRFPLLDTAVALVLTALGIAEAWLGLTGHREPAYVVVTVPLVTLPLLFRRSHPEAALLVVLGALVVQAAAGSEIGGGFAEGVALVVAIYSAAAATHLLRSVGLLMVALAAETLVILLDGEARAGNFVYACSVVGAAWLAGRGVRLADERSDLLAERRAAQERSRIARELHDVVSHHVSAIVVQAGAERRDLEAGSGTAQVLADIEAHGRETLQELRRLLGLLRVDETGAAPLAPQPGLDDLPRLVDTVRSTGVEVELATSGTPRATGDGIGLTAYRVVQEALTNVRKHSHDARAEVRIRWLQEELAVEVLSTGRASRQRGLPGSGYGLRAMAERVHAYGGSVTAGPCPDGYQVLATLPLGEL